MGAEGALHLASALEKNRTLTTLECAPLLLPSPSRSAVVFACVTHPFMSAANLPCPQPQRERGGRRGRAAPSLGSQDKYGAHDAQVRAISSA
eukprot:scaffold105484_cov28-Tisochrysis_lutea.AAC.6